MVTSQQPGLLEGEPMLGLEIGALWTGPVPTGVVPDARHMAVRTRLDMTAQRGRPALHEGARGFADVRGQGMGVFIGGKGVLEERLQRDERHQCLRTSGNGASSGCFVQYHANYPRCKRLVHFYSHCVNFARSTRPRSALTSVPWHALVAHDRYGCGPRRHHTSSWVWSPPRPAVRRRRAGDRRPRA